MEERATLIAEGRIIAGKVRLERPLARGGMGAVWVGHHLSLDAPVAVKFMEPSLAASEQARARFEREAKSAAQLQSPWVVQVRDYGVEGDTPYIIMELLVGEDLGQRLQKKGRLRIGEATQILDQVCKALRRAHEAGLVHRDLKPGNIFLARQGDEEGVKLLDFGIAKLITPGSPASGDVTRSGHLVGSPLYMSPEQIRRSKEVDHRSDLWSLGVILYQALTGHTPFVEDEIGAVLVAICTDPIPAPSAVAPDLGPEVDKFFERALARDPAKRFQSAREVYEAFAALSGLVGASAKQSDGGVPVRVQIPHFDAEAPTERAPSLNGGAESDGAGSAMELAQTVPAGESAPRAGARRAGANAAAGPAQGAPEGTLSPAGVTQEDPHAPARKPSSFVMMAAALLVAVAAGGWWLIKGSHIEPTALEEKPGSPTLPLPPPSSEPTVKAVAREEALKAPVAAPVQKPESAASAEPAVSTSLHTQSIPARGDSSPASVKRDRTGAASAKAQPTQSPSAGAASDAKELGLE